MLEENDHMALSIRIRGVPVRENVPCWSMDNVFWWDMRPLREQYPVREIVDATLYLDYVVVLTPSEALDWNQRFGESYRQMHGSAGTNCSDAIDELTRKLESTRDALRWVIVEQYEWESGL
jgi:hypothetical protein